MSIDLITGDITTQPDLDVVVNAANAALMPGGGVAGAIHAAAGPELARACEPLAPIEPGQAVITPGFGLPNAHVIHALGPRYGLDEPSDVLLAACYENALALCMEHDLKSIGFPALSAGAFGYPLDEAARIAVASVKRHVPEGVDVHFVLFDDQALAAFRAHA